jgi:hypothetical protein
MIAQKSIILILLAALTIRYRKYLITTLFGWAKKGRLIKYRPARSLIKTISKLPIIKQFSDKLETRKFVPDGFAERAETHFVR